MVYVFFCLRNTGGMQFAASSESLKFNGKPTRSVMEEAFIDYACHEVERTYLPLSGTVPDIHFPSCIPS